MSKNVVHFPLLKTKAVTKALSRNCSSQLVALQQAFIRRFADFKAMERKVDLLSSPFASDIEETAKELQMELIDLQSNNTLKKGFESKPFIDFYASLHSEKVKNLK